MIKCIYREDTWAEKTHCDKEADYIFIGKSYCREHMEIRNKEIQKEIQLEKKMQERETEEFKKRLFT